MRAVTVHEIFFELNCSARNGASCTDECAIGAGHTIVCMRAFPLGDSAAEDKRPIDE